MERMVDHMHRLLERASGPMSFAVIVPGWDDAGCVSYQNMKRSRFARPHQGARKVGTEESTSEVTGKIDTSREILFSLALSIL